MHMKILSDAYGMVVLALSIVVLTAVWRTHKDKVKADIRRIGRLLHRQR